MNESFEFLILKSGIVSVAKEIIVDTFDYADSKKYLSWEEFYTDYLIKQTQDTVFQYSKSKLKDSYKSISSIEKIKNQLPEPLRP